MSGVECQGVSVEGECPGVEVPGVKPSAGFKISFICQVLFSSNALLRSPTLFFSERRHGLFII